MFPWAFFRRTACGDDSGIDEETQRSDVRDASPAARSEEVAGCRKMNVLVWRGDAKLGGYQWETMDDLTDISGDDDSDVDDSTTSEAAPPAKKLKTEECHEHAPKVAGAMQEVYSE